MNIFLLKPCSSSLIKLVLRLYPGIFFPNMQGAGWECKHWVRGRGVIEGEGMGDGMGIRIELCQRGLASQLARPDPP